jgi:hypothetical protein
MRRRGRLFEDGPIGAQIAAQHHRAAFGKQRLVLSADHVAVVARSFGDVGLDRLAVYRQAVPMQQRQKLAHHRGTPPAKRSLPSCADRWGER